MPDPEPRLYRQINYQTAQWVPPWLVSLRCEDGARPAPAYRGYYRDGWWTFEVPDAIGDFRFRLVLDEMVVSDVFDSKDGSRIRERQVTFTQPPLWSEQGRLQRAWFPVGADQEVWDVIVVGTGMGGGSLLYELASQPMRVLGIEAGPLKLLTHVANLPRRVREPNPGQASTMWGLYEELGVCPFALQSSDGDVDHVSWKGREIFGLGGRSVMWGGLCPRLSSRDAKDWPANVVAELSGTWYEGAEHLMNVAGPLPSSFELETLRKLRALPELADRLTDRAPVAVELEDPQSWRISSGMFSTADLLLTTRLRVPQGGDPDAENWPPYIHLSEMVSSVAQGDDKIWSVRTTTVTDGAPHEYRAKTVVLAAGTVESARIALSSGLAGPESLMGVGLTEHDMWWAHFQVPHASADPEKSVKVLSVPGPDAVDDWNMLVEINVDLNEERLPARELRQPYLQVDDGHVGGQVVFLCRGPLRPTQKVTKAEGHWLEFNVADDHLLPNIEVTITPDEPGEAPMNAVLAAVVAAVDAQPMHGHDRVALARSSRGYVAHEVGTMRMPGPRGVDGNANDCVVDENLQVIGHPGLYVCDNSVFPAAPAANPSLTLVALSLRLADRLTRTL